MVLPLNSPEVLLPFTAQNLSRGAAAAWLLCAQKMGDHSTYGLPSPITLSSLFAQLESFPDPLNRSFLIST